MKNILGMKNILSQTIGIDISSIEECGTDRVLFFATDFFCDLETEDNEKTLSFSQISIPRNLRGKGLSKEIIQNMEKFAKENGYSKFKIPAVISSRAAKTLENLNYIHEDFNYPDFDPSLYEEFDGFYGTYYKFLKEE